LTDFSRKNLRTLIDAFSEYGWGTVALNDASLPWGGRYDIRADWKAPHAGHREGREIDISFTRAQNQVSAGKQKSFYKKFC
jgi:murein endopeptidase